MGVRALNETGIVGVRGVSAESEETASASGSRRRANGTGSGGGRLLVNSDRGGSRVDEFGYNGCRRGRRNTDIGLTTTTGPDTNYPEATKLGSPAKVDAGLGRGWPPLAPAPRVAAFPQPRRGISGGGGSRHVGMRTSAFAGLPFADAPLKRNVGDNATEPKSLDERVEPSGAVPRWDGNDNCLQPVTCPGSNAAHQSDVIAASEGDCGLEGGQGTHDGMRSVSRCDEESVDLKPVDAVSAAERGRDAKRTFEENPIKEVTGFCGVEAAPEADAAATGRMITCDPVRLQPTRAAVRHWHQFFSR